MIELLTGTGFGSTLMILIGCIVAGIYAGSAER